MIKKIIVSILILLGGGVALADRSDIEVTVILTQEDVTAFTSIFNYKDEIRSGTGFIANPEREEDHAIRKVGELVDNIRTEYDRRVAMDAAKEAAEIRPKTIVTR